MVKWVKWREKSHDRCVQDLCYFFPVSADCLRKHTATCTWNWHFNISNRCSLWALTSHLPRLGDQHPNRSVHNSLGHHKEFESVVLQSSIQGLEQGHYGLNSRAKALENQVKGKTWIKRQKLLLMVLHHRSSGRNIIQTGRKIQSLLNQNSDLSKITEKDIMLSGQVILRNFVPSGIDIIHNQW